MTEHSTLPAGHEHNFTNRVVKVFLDSNLSLVLILLATIVGLAALGLTPREEDPQIVVPLADVYVNFPGHSAAKSNSWSRRRWKKCSTRSTASSMSTR